MTIAGLQQLKQNESPTRMRGIAWAFWDLFSSVAAYSITAACHLWWYKQNRHPNVLLQFLGAILTSEGNFLKMFAVKRKNCRDNDPIDIEGGPLIIFLCLDESLELSGLG